MCMCVCVCVCVCVFMYVCVCVCVCVCKGVSLIKNLSEANFPDENKNNKLHEIE